MSTRGIRSGAIIGALAAGFVLIPWLGFSLGAKVSGLTSFALAGAAILLLPKSRLVPAVCVGSLFVAVIFAYEAPRPDALFRALTRDAGSSVTQLFYGVGRSATIIVNDVDGSLEMRSEGLPRIDDLPLGQPSIETLAVLAHGRCPQLHDRTQETC